MKNRATLWNRGLPLLVLALFWTLIYLRALPAWFRGSYTTEGGEWLSQMWRIGFFNAIKTIRPDYCVFGNLVVLQVSEVINTLLHGANIDRAPLIQHHVAVGYVAAMFTFVFMLLRRSHGAWSSLLVCMGMLLVPDLDDENRIFGEATNLGYFSALVVLFVFYDLWMNPRASTRRLAGYFLLVAFHIATSPMAGIITVAWSGLLGVRMLLERKSDSSVPRGRFLAFMVPVIVYSLLTIVHAQRYAPSSEPTDMAIFKRSFVEIVLARQLLYPLITNFFLSFTDRLTLISFALLLVLIGWYVVYEWRHEKRSWQRLTAILVVFGAAAGMSLATAYTRQWIYAHELHYASVWPARYYIAQNMVVAGFLGLLLVRLCELNPRLQSLVLAFAGAIATNYALQQVQKTSHYLAQDDPHIVARYWPYQVRRVHAVQSLIGDNEGLSNLSEKPVYTAEINIENHFMELSVERMEKAVATPLALKSDATPVGFVDSAEMKPEAGEATRKFHAEDFRIIPRKQGALVTFDLRLDDMPLFDIRRRKLWLGKMPGEVKAIAFTYDIPRADRSLTDVRRGRWSQNRLLKVYLFFPGAWSVGDLRQKFDGLPCALGETPGQCIATTTVLGPADRPCLSFLPGDDAFALKLHPLKKVFDWACLTKPVKLVNCTFAGSTITTKAAGPSVFEEEAYLRYNPDIAVAVASHAVTSGRAYYETLGRDEARQICRYSATIPVMTPMLTTSGVAGVEIKLHHHQGPLPPTITCVLQGDAGQATPVRLRPAAAETQYATYLLPETFTATPHPVHSLEIQFEGITDSGHAFGIDEVKLYGH